MVRESTKVRQHRLRELAEEQQRLEDAEEAFSEQDVSESDDDSEDEGDEEEDMEEEVGFAGGGMLASIMNSVGPIIKTVVVHPHKTKAKPEEITVDMTPSLNPVVKVLGGNATFIGQYDYPKPKNSTLVVMVVRESEREGLEANNYTLKPPYDELDDDDAIFGPILVIKMSEASEPLNLTLKEWKAFKGVVATKVAAKKSAKKAAPKKKSTKKVAPEKKASTKKATPTKKAAPKRKTSAKKAAPKAKRAKK
jgi:hypothetical protein